ncbi:MAG: hypothetical protein E4H20_04185 [Spirochaetales bacterium]|nr:MAG: hypothetical protein E4H20_04185 [Spirochaetales bacterium]
MSHWTELLGALDPDRQLPAVRETRNAVVAAGAGSGKTRVLSVRYLALVKERGIAPERILCLTFTNKAAAEMRERIRGMLAECAGDDPDFARALEAFPASRVSTMDSFCSEIARNGSARWGVPPDFSIDEDSARDATKIFATDYLLARVAKSPIRDFIAVTGFERALDALCSLAAGRGGLLGALDESFDPADQNRIVSAAIVSMHEAIRAALAAGVDLDTGGTAGAVAWVEAATAFPANPPDTHDHAALKSAAERYRSLKAMRQATGKSQAALYYHDEAKNLRSRLEAAAFACDVLLDDRRGPALDFLKDFLEGAAAERSASGVLGFADVAAMARDTLILDRDLRNWYKRRFDAIMIDEFQDDNSLQKDLLYLLAERLDNTVDGIPAADDLRQGVLFFVGDEKQSIYAFRQADVTVFRGLAAELERSPGGLGRHELTVNYRSEPGLITFFNATFSSILPPPDADWAREYEARFVPLEPGPVTEGLQPVVRYLETDRPEDDNQMKAEETQAHTIAQLIRDLVDNGVPVTCKGRGGRKEASLCRYEDIAILFRSTASQNVAERHLRLAGVPYTATSTAGLYVESILGDLYAALRLTAYPDDRHAYATLLRGPFARLSDDSIARLLLSGDEKPFCVDADDLPVADRPRYLAARDTWAGLGARADREPLRRLVAWLWYDRGLRWNVLKDPANAAYLEHFDYAWALAQAADARGERLSDFVSGLEEYIGRVEKLDKLSVPRESARGVSVMTVHASKGLEFPVVILPSVENVGRNDGSSPIRRNRRFGFSLRLPDASGDPVDALAALDKALDAMARDDGDRIMDEGLAETSRLFYVACTRAINRLYLLGKAPSASDDQGKSFRGLLRRSWPWIGPANAKDVDSAPRQPVDETTLLTTESIPCLTLADYHGTVSRSGSEGASLAALIASLDAPLPPSRRARFSVTGIAAKIEANRAPERLAEGSDGAGDPRETRMDTADSIFLDEEFNEADFGTLCHESVESALVAPREPFRASTGLDRKLSRMSTDRRDQLLTEAHRLAEGFSHSGIADEARRAKIASTTIADSGTLTDLPAIFRTEYPFVYRAASSRGPVYLSGAMDLVYGDASGVTVIDFKTDRHEEPAAHEFQLAVYRKAASDLFVRPAKAIIYYLRSGHSAEITADPDDFNLDGALPITEEPA